MKRINLKTAAAAKMAALAMAAALGCTAYPVSAVYADTTTESAAQEQSENDVLSGLTSSSDTALQSASTTTENQTAKTSWNMTSIYDLTRMANITVNENVTRYEFFYADAEAEPVITFTSPSGQIYTVQDGSQTNAEGDVLLCRTGNTIIDSNDVRYDVVYIASTSEPGSWVLSMTLQQNTKVFVALTAALPEDYESLTQEYRTEPDEPFLWYDGTSDGSYYNRIPTFIAAENSGDLSDPAVYTAQEEAAQQQQQAQQSMITLAVLFGILMVIIISVLVYMSKKSQKNMHRKAKQKALSSVSKKVREQKNKADNDLADYLNKFNDEYSDDADEPVPDGSRPKPDKNTQKSEKAKPAHEETAVKEERTGRTAHQAEPEDKSKAAVPHTDEAAPKAQRSVPEAEAASEPKEDQKITQKTVSNAKNGNSGGISYEGTQTARKAENAPEPSQPVHNNPAPKKKPSWM